MKENNGSKGIKLDHEWGAGFIETRIWRVVNNTKDYSRNSYENLLQKKLPQIHTYIKYIRQYRVTNEKPGARIGLLPLQLLTSEVPQTLKHFRLLPLLLVTL